MQRSPRLAACCLAVVLGAAALVVPLTRSLDDDERSEPAPATTGEAVADLQSAAEGTLDLTRDPETGSVDTLVTEPGATLDLEAREPEAAGTEFADRYGEALGATGSDLVTLGAVDRLAGGSAVRLQQEVGGVPVYGGQASLQLDESGDVESALSDLSARAATVDTHADLAAEEAREQALARVARDTGVPVHRLEGSAPARWIFDPEVVGAPEQGGARLAWRVEVTGPDVATTVLVDADQGGAFLAMDQDVHALQRSVCDRPAPDDRNCNGGPYARTEHGPPSGVGEVNQAFGYLGFAYLFFRDRFDRDSLDGAGLPLRATVRWCSATTCDYDNAFWHGTPGEEGIVLGSGFVTDDIVGHELTHGLVQYTAGLFTQYQSGAINESMADVFGELIDLTDGFDGAGGDVRWLMGEDRAAGHLRNLMDPTAKNHPDTMTSPLYRGDAGGMHANAGVGNRAAALMTDGGTVGSTTITGLGADKVAAIWYEALTAHLTSGSDYADLAHALPQACADLVGTLGMTLGDCAQVESAVGAVQMATDPPQAPAPEAPVCPDGIEPMDLFADDFEDPTSGRWTTSADGGWNWRYPPPDSQRYATSGDLNLWGPDTGQPHLANGTGNQDFGDARIAMTNSV
ncbi:MAG TPA: M4 family metallopeptidase, partial [Acidimicrobiales bacterium]|nr:M4 family metallopeptidase [Acidimicrobiales bacterium]